MNYNLLRKALAPFVQLLWPVEIINKSKFVEEKGVYICNHYSVFDANHFATQLFSRGINALIKEEALKSSIAKRFLLSVGVIPIKRGEADMRAIKTAMNVLRNDGSLIVFPEGTRNKDGGKQMLPFKDGTAVMAIKNKTNIHPMMYYRPIKLFRKTYLIIGDEIDMSQYFASPIKDVRHDASDYMRAKMEELRYDLDAIVEDKERLRTVRKNDKMRLKEAKRADKKAKKLAKKAKKGARTAKIGE